MRFLVPMAHITGGVLPLPWVCFLKSLFLTACDVLDLQTLHSTGFMRKVYQNRHLGSRALRASVWPDPLIRCQIASLRFPTVILRKGICSARDALPAYPQGVPKCCYGWAGAGAGVMKVTECRMSFRCLRRARVSAAVRMRVFPSSVPFAISSSCSSKRKQVPPRHVT